ncbi:MAG: hypothetical protein WDO24_09665 [Pseudomonadota bacterium]
MMPVLLEALRLSMIFNFTGVLIAEMYASRTGIGQLMANWGENFQLRQLFAGVLFLGHGRDPCSTSRSAGWRGDAAPGGRERAGDGVGPRSRSPT